LQKKSRRQNVQHNNRPAKDSSLSIKEKLTRQYENLKNEIQTYENNLAAISTSSKTGNGFIDSIKENIASLKKEAEEILNKIRGLDKEDSAE
jgi:predicted  nucleic acid-binding Zn-ribbon protein